MRALPLIVALTLTCGAPVAFAQAQEEDHSAHHPAPSTQPQAAQPGEHDHGAAAAAPLQDNMRNIEALMQQIREAGDPARKRELLGQHLQALQQQMQLIVGQRSAGKMSMKESAKADAGMPEGSGKECDMMKDGGMMKEGGMMKGGGMMMMHKKTEQRLGMLERLLQQMVEREAVEAELGNR